MLALNYFAFPPLITAALVAAIGAFTTLKNPGRPQNYFFGLLCFSSTVWLFCFGMMYLSVDPAVALRWARLGFVGITFIPVFAYNFILAYLNIKSRLIPLLYIFSVLGLSVSFTDLVYSGVRSHPWGFYPTAGNFYALFLTMFTLLFGHGVWLLLRRLMNQRQERKYPTYQQTLYVLLAFFSGATGVVDYIAKYPVPIYPWGYFSALGLISIIAYSILKHRLMDIEVIIKRTLQFGVVFSVVFALFGAITFLVTYQLGISPFWAGFLTLLIAMLVSDPLNRRVKTVTDPFLFQEEYNYEQKLTDQARTMLRLMPLKIFVRLSLRNLVRVSRLKGGVAFVQQDHNDLVVLAAERELQSLRGQRISKDSPLVKRLPQTSYLLQEQLKSDTQGEEDKQAAEELRHLGISLCFPAIFEGKLQGFVGLTERMSESPYTDRMILFFQNLVNQAAISIHNCREYDRQQKGRQQVEARLEEAFVKAERQARLAALGDLTANLAHEIKNPLTPVRSQIEMIPQHLEDKAFLLNVHATAIRGIDRATELLKEMTAMAKVQELPARDININNLIDDVLFLEDLELQKREIKVEKNYGNLSPVEGVPRRLHQSLLNIISNAIWAIGRNGTISITTREEGGKITIEIIDSGPGIPPEALEHLFEPFFTTRFEGTGLGLAIAHRAIVDEMGGRIEAGNQPGHGAIFKIWLPLAKT